MPDIARILKKLHKIIKKAIKANPYNKNKEQTAYKMWIEQCKINFPILYLSSIFLYEYGRERDCNNYLFATRDCCHFYKVFAKLYPKMTSTYFHCSRNMFENALEKNNQVYKNYVRNQIKDKVTKTVFIDIHGTGKRMFSYFEKEFEKVPYCFLLSATFNSFDDFPEISKKYYKKDKIFNLVFNTRGSPIEMLNYDNVGTLHDYCEYGPIRDQLEYDYELIKPYHDCMDFMVNLIRPKKSNIDCKHKIKLVKNEIKKYFKVLSRTELELSNYIRHIGKHKKKDIIDGKLLQNDDKKKLCVKKHEEITFDKIISDDTVYSIVWEGTFKGKTCVIKMIKLDTGICDTCASIYECSNEEPYRHKDFKYKKPMSVDNFLEEIKMQKYLNDKGLAPKVYEHWTCNKYEVHYGFIVMEKLDCSLKQLIKKRSIGHDEEKIIFKMINQLHSYKIIHGDLKPSNIGVNLDSNGKIIFCCFLDCQKVKRNCYNINNYIKRDWHNYYEHKKNNMSS